MPQKFSGELLDPVPAGPDLADVGGAEVPVFGLVLEVLPSTLGEVDKLGRRCSL